MKKFVKPLVIAASVAAVAGIGAVSFAKWSGDDINADQTVTAGSVAVASFTKDSEITSTAITGLLPYDQTATTSSITPATDDHTMGDVVFNTISFGSTTQSYTITVERDTTAWNLHNDSKVYVSKATTVSAITDLSTDTNWQEVDAADGATLSFANTVTTPTIHVILVSGEETDMTQTFKLKFTLEGSESALGA